MEIKNKKIGIIFDDSVISMKNIIQIIKDLKKKNGNVFPIMTNDLNTYYEENKYKKEKQELMEKIEQICNKKIITSLQDFKIKAPKKLMDIIIVIPTKENTISKIISDLIDTPELIIIKMHLKYNIPIVIAPLLDNGLGSSAMNIGILLDRKNYYFVPFKQNNPITNPKAISFDPSLVIKTIESALDYEQIEPLLL